MLADSSVSQTKSFFFAGCGFCILTHLLTSSRSELELVFTLVAVTVDAVSPPCIDQGTSWLRILELRVTYGECPGRWNPTCAQVWVIYFFFLFAKCQGSVFICLTFNKACILMSFFRRLNLFLALKSGLDNIMTLLLCFQKRVRTCLDTHGERTNCIKHEQIGI